MAKRTCKGTTKKGTPCKARPLHDGDFCLAHADEETRESAGFGGAQEGAGRPARPRVVDVIRERIEADVEKVISVLEEALEATRPVVVGSGEHAEVEMVTDYVVRIHAARELLDRAYGKPKQQTEVTGADGGPVQTTTDVDIADPESRRLLGELLRRAAPPRP